MKRYLCLAAILFGLTSISLFALDTVLVDGKSKKAEAFMDSNFTIYLWDGTPCAYLSNFDRNSSEGGTYRDIWGFNGKHLGFMDLQLAIIWTNDSYAAGFVQEGSYNNRPGAKKPRPQKAYREAYMPVLWPKTERLSRDTLKTLLERGVVKQTE